MVNSEATRFAPLLPVQNTEATRPETSDTLSDTGSLVASQHHKGI